MVSVNKIQLQDAHKYNTITRDRKEKTHGDLVGIYVKPLA